MLTVRDLITAARLAQGLPSNYALANLMQVRERDISRWFNGHHVPADPMVLRLAELAKLDAAEVLPTIAALRTDDSHLRAAWHRAAELAHRGAAVAACAVLALWISDGGADGGQLADSAVSAPVDKGFTVYTLQSVFEAVLRVFCTLAHGQNGVQFGGRRHLGGLAIVRP